MTNIGIGAILGKKLTVSGLNMTHNAFYHLKMMGKNIGVHLGKILGWHEEYTP